MGFWARLFGLEERAALNIETATSDSDSAAALLKAIVGTGEIDSKTAMEIPAFSAAVEFISGIVAGLPVKLYEENTDGAVSSTNEITEDERLILLNEETGDLMGAFDARKAQIVDMLVHGAGYMFVNRGGTGVRSLHYVKHGDVSVSKSPDPIFKDADIWIGGRRYQPWQFVIMAQDTKDGVTGVGMVEKHRTILAAMYNELKYENVLSRTGGNKKGFLKSAKHLTNEAMATLRRAWEELYANNGNNMMVLNDGLDYVPSAASAVEMQLNQNKLTNSGQIDLAFMLSPEVISGRASRDQYVMAITNAVLPTVRMYQEAINRSLLLESEKRRKYFVLDTTELLKGDIQARYQAYEIGLRNNILQVDEVRYKEDLPPTGFNYIKLALSDVLLDPKTGQIYTPNTNQLVAMDGGIAKCPENDLQNSGGADIIDTTTTEIRKKTNRAKGKNGRFAGSTPMYGGGAAKRMSVKERVRVTHEINTYYDRMDNSKPVLSKSVRNHFFIFENGGYNNYKFLAKIKIEGNEDYIDMIRKDMLK